LIHRRNKLVITPEFGSFLNKLGLKSCKDLDHGLWRRELDRVHFCASRSDRHNIHQAAEKVIVAINDLAKRGYITASLMELGVLHLAIHNKPEPEYVVLSCVAITDEGHKYVEANMPKMFVDEGGLPERFEDQ
jgi:hypothetical protein